MSKRLYVGNLSFSTTEEGLAQAFAPYGASDISMPTDEGGRPRGFAFVEIPEDSQAQQAIQAMNGKELDGRELVVNEARPRVERGGGGGYGGGGGGRGGGGGGGGRGGYGGGRGGRW